MNQIKLPEGVRWIGVKRGNASVIETVYFKTTFELTKPSPESVVRISANTRYLLFVNGREINNGPCKGDHWHQYCDAVDIAPYLKPGKNVFAVKVTAFPPFEATNEDYSNFGPFWAMTGSEGPMLMVWGELGEVDISTGIADWHYLADSAIRWNIQRLAHWMGCTEEVEGAKIPHGWQADPEIREPFKPAAIKWDNTVRFGEVPRLFLYERPIELLLRKEIGDLSVLAQSDGFNFPINGGEAVIPANCAYEAILDAARMTTAYVYLSCKEGAGSKVTILYSEAFFIYDGERYYKEDRADPSGELRGVMDIYRPGGGFETYSPSWFRAFRFIKVTIETGGNPLTLYPLKLIETRYPLENKVRFEYGQPWLRQVWDISLRTLELCMHETYEDCPFYEQLQYIMDTRMQMLFTYTLGNDTAMQIKTIHDFHSSMLPEGMIQSRFPSKYPQVIPIFSLHWVFMLHDYYMETGDLDLVERYRPTMENIFGWFKRKTGSLGLIEHLDYWDFADWTDAWGDIAGMPRAALYGPSTINNLTYAYALEVGALVMDALDYSKLAENYRAEKAGILEKVEMLCWSAKRCLYREGPGFEEYSQHAQLWAVLSGLAKGERAKDIMRITLFDDSLVPCSFVLQFYLFRALEEAGMYEETQTLWDLWKDLIDLNCTTVPEIPGKYNRSECHAWGSLLLYEMPRKFLGVAPMLPGYKKLTIKPMGLYLGAISGQAPTPYGDACVKWCVNGGRFAIEGDVPVPALVVLPDGTEYETGRGPFAFDTLVKYDNGSKN